MTITEIAESIYNKNKPKFKIGDKVVSKLTGFPVCGIILAIEFAKLYHAKMQNQEMLTWNKLFKDWNEKYIYTLGLNEPVQTLTKEEFESYGDLTLGYEYENLPKTCFIAYCEDDLELF